MSIKVAFGFLIASTVVILITLLKNNHLKRLGIIILLPDYNSVFFWFKHFVSFFYIESFVETVNVFKRSKCSEISRCMWVGFYLVDQSIFSHFGSPDGCP